MGTKKNHSIDSQHSAAQTQGIAIALAIFSLLALLFVRWTSFLHQAKWILVAEAIGYVALLCAIAFVAKELTSRIRLWVATGYLLSPLITHYVMRFVGMGEATEILMLQSCQNVALITSLMRWKSNEQAQQISVLFSFFLVFFVTTLSESLIVFLFTIPYVVLGIWWLMVRHWSRLEVHIPSQVTSNFSVRTTAFGVTMLLLATTCLLVGWKHKQITKTINGFMPTSGGKRISDRFARGGTGDGDFFVAAQNHATTVGPVESDLFLESTKPSLFDIIQENYDRPLLPKRKKSERAFSPDDVKMQHSHQKIIQSEQSGRTFRTLRGSPEERIQVTEELSKALFYLNGPTPIRLSLGYYDRFDGLDWSVSKSMKSLPKKRMVGEEVDGKFWIRFQENKRPVSRDKEGTSRRSHPYFEGFENHSIKIMRLSTNRLLLPSSSYAWHFNKCNETSFFDVEDDGSIEFEGRDAIPELAVYHLISRGVNYRNLSANDVSLVRADSPYNWLPEDEDVRQLGLLTRQITTDVKGDWQKLNSIVGYLRANFRHLRYEELASDIEAERQIQLDDEGSNDSPIQIFLHEQAGPDYMFATVASVMLRSLGMETRLVKGFFVGDQNFDAYSGQSIVTKSDMHFWLEVRVNGADWITVEPTPGYPLPRSKLTMWQRIVTTSTLIFHWMLSKWIAMTVIAVALIMAWVLRAYLRALIVLMIWFVLGTGSVRRRVLATVRILERNSNIETLSNRSIHDLCAELGFLHLDEVSSSQTTKPFSQFISAVNQILYCSKPKVDDTRDLRQACFSLAFLSVNARLSKSSSK